MKYLFERLVEQRGDVTGPVSFDLKTAVRDNVRRVLTNRIMNEINEAPDVLRCGLPSVVEFVRDSHSALERYSARVNDLIRYYEPRLRDPIVEVAGGGAVPVSIIVTAKLASPDGVEEMRFPVSETIED